jgi:hypothetical protein
VVMLERNLDDLINGEKNPKFKSEGECRIAYFLKENSIRYQYESGLLVHSDRNKPRIWYPDFYLPEFGAYIEYYGLRGRQSYDEGIKRKETTYSRMGLDVIPVYPWSFVEDWQGYIMKELDQRISRRYKTLMDKPYWSQKSSTGYHKGSTRHY